MEPRAGIRLGKLWGTDWAITASYRWDFPEFKLDKEHTIDGFTLGIGFVM